MKLKPLYKIFQIFSNFSINSIFQSFEKIKEWADIGNWLSKIVNLLNTHPSPFIKEKIVFAKRLS